MHDKTGFDGNIPQPGESRLDLDTTRRLPKRDNRPTYRASDGGLSMRQFDARKP